MRLKDKVALITGAGRGLGEAIALAYAHEGASQVIVSRTKEEIEAVADKARKLGGEIEAITANVVAEKDVEALVSQILNRLGRIDVLVNCAGIYGPIGPLWKLDAAQWVEALNINLVGTFLCSRAVLRHMVKRRAGKIINLAGGGGTAPVPRFSAYAASKAAVVRLTENLAEEVREYGIQVNSIAPGLIDTKLQDRVLEAGEDAGELLGRIRQLRAQGKGGVSPQVPAGLAVFLASSASDGLTGRLIAAPHDGWEKWDAKQIERVMGAPWFTLRRMDPFTLGTFAGKRLDE
ncbi:MAG: SDR family oxidoreductase [Deltaproteobacteria bacterium]|nr:SDR family oxidoreductase [Deltaproteobacteria bacterium]